MTFVFFGRIFGVMTDGDAAADRVKAFSRKPPVKAELNDRFLQRNILKMIEDVGNSKRYCKMSLLCYLESSIFSDGMNFF